MQICVLTVLIVGSLQLALPFRAEAASAKAANNWPYVAAMQGGVFYARWIPTRQYDSAGYTEVFRVGMKANVRVARYEWYSREGLVLGWSPITGAVAVMAKIRDPADTLDQQVELNFYLNGKRPRSWTAAELQKLGASIGRERELQGSSRGAEFQLLDCVQVDGNEYAFRIAVGEGKKLSFDILTGEVYRRTSCHGDL